MKGITSFCSSVLLGLLIISTSSCKKQETDKQVTDNQDNTTKLLGEKRFQVGSYQTWSEVIDFAHDKGYVVAGTASNEENGNYPFLALLDDSLSVTKVLFPASTLNQAWTQGLTKLSDGYVLLSTYAGNQDNTTGVYLTKISFTGSIIWEKEYLTGFSTWGPTISSDSDNSIVILCQQTLPPDYRFYSRIAKIDSEGNILWSNDFYPEILNEPEIIITDKQGNYIAIIDSITDHFGSGEDRVSMPVVNKINKDGTILWTKTLDSDNGRAWMTRASVDNDNNIIVAHQPGSKNVVLKLDPSGNILWKKILTNDFERMREITVDNENNIYIIGDSSAPKWVALVRLSSEDGSVLNKKLYYKDPIEYPDHFEVSEYLGNSFKYVSDKKLVVLTTEYFPYQAAVFYMTNGFEIL